MVPLSHVLLRYVLAVCR